MSVNIYGNVYSIQKCVHDFIMSMQAEHSTVDEVIRVKLPDTDRLITLHEIINCRQGIRNHITISRCQQQPETVLISHTDSQGRTQRIGLQIRRQLQSIYYHDQGTVGHQDVSGC